MGSHVLIADDDPSVRQMLAMLVTSLGAEPALAKDGQQALACLQQQRFDLVLLDVMMPVLDGMAVLAQIRARVLGPRIPVVMVTAMEGALIEERLRVAGANAYLRKPIDVGDAVSTLRPFL